VTLGLAETSDLQQRLPQLALVGGLARIVADGLAIGVRRLRVVALPCTNLADLVVPLRQILLDRHAPLERPERLPVVPEPKVGLSEPVVGGEVAGVQLNGSAEGCAGGLVAPVIVLHLSQVVQRQVVLGVQPCGLLVLLDGPLPVLPVLVDVAQGLVREGELGVLLHGPLGRLHGPSDVLRIGGRLLVVRAPKIGVSLRRLPVAGIELQGLPEGLLCAPVVLPAQSLPAPFQKPPDLLLPLPLRPRRRVLGRRRRRRLPAPSRDPLSAAVRSGRSIRVGAPLGPTGRSGLLSRKLVRARASI